MPGDARHADGGGEVGLAGAGSADEHDVLRLFSERQFSQRVDQLAVHRRTLEVEACQFAVHRELGGVHLMADRAHSAVRGLGLQQVRAVVFTERFVAMSTPAGKLRLGPLPKTEVVKLTISVPAALKAELDRYAALHAQTYGEAVNAAALIPLMLEAFVARDRGFRMAAKPGRSPARVT